MFACAKERIACAIAYDVVHLNWECVMPFISNNFLFRCINHVIGWTEISNSAVRPMRDAVACI